MMPSIQVNARSPHRDCRWGLLAFIAYPADGLLDNDLLAVADVQALGGLRSDLAACEVVCVAYRKMVMNTGKSVVASSFLRSLV